PAKAPKKVEPVEEPPEIIEKEAAFEPSVPAEPEISIPEEPAHHAPKSDPESKKIFDDERIVVPSGPPELQAILSKWNDVLHKVRESDISIYMFAAAGVPANVEGNVLTMEFKPEHSFHFEMMNNKARVAVMEKALLSATGFEARIKVATAGRAEDNSSQPVGNNDAEEEVKAQPKAAPETAAEAPAQIESKPQPLSLFDTLNEVFPSNREI
ncbi:MAG TPA: hypothetical protein PLQ76_05550, partial [bacterium]|nr:hypothetical protein [bacterium]